MTTPVPTIPTIKDLYDRTEAFFTAPLQTLLGTETVASLMGTTREQYLTQSKTTRTMWESHWASLRLPSLVDHARLAGQVVALENKIEGLEDQLSAMAAQLDILVARTKSSKPERATGELSTANNSK
jgi:hypothetical protein